MGMGLGWAVRRSLVQCIWQSDGSAVPLILGAELILALPGTGPLKRVGYTGSFRPTYSKPVVAAQNLSEASFNHRIVDLQLSAIMPHALTSAFCC